jgi:hypothetical protein
MNHPLARKTDPETSHEAGEYVRPKLPHQHALILSAMVRRQRPLTASEIEMDCDRAEPHKRLRDMERLGLVVRCDPRFCTVTGRRATTWRIK